MPVINVDHATGLCGGMVVASRLNSPSLASLSRLGRELIWASTNFGSIPSIPSTMTLGVLDFESARLQPAWANAPANIAKQPRNVKASRMNFLREVEDRLAFHPS